MHRPKDVEDYIQHLDYWQTEVRMLREIALSSELEESIKWNAPCYDWQGKNVVGLAAFKDYAGIWFFQGSLLKDEFGHLMNAQEGKTKAMLQWRFTDAESIKKAPIAEYILESIENFKNGIVIKNSSAPKPLVVPEELAIALKDAPELDSNWNSFSLSCQREFAEYISEAKREDTRQRRLAKVKEMIMAKKGLHDAYKK
ncbi:MAG: YdeI/OmpD-associated family protein [Saprospiraceae bacterium]